MGLPDLPSGGIFLHFSSSSEILGAPSVTHIGVPMPAAFKVSCKEKKPQICRTKLQAYNYGKLYKALNYTDVIITEATRDGKGETEVAVGGKRISECGDLEVVLDDMIRCRGILRKDMEKRKLILQHLEAEASPLTSSETYKEADPEAFTVDTVVVPILECLGYTASNISKDKGADLLLNLKGTRIVLSAEVLDDADYEKDTLKIIELIREGGEDCMGGIATDGRRWLFAVLVNGNPVNSGLIDLRDLLRMMYAKTADVKELAKFAGVWKYFTEMMSADTIIASARTMFDRFSKQTAVEVKSE